MLGLQLRRRFLLGGHQELLFSVLAQWASTTAVSSNDVPNAPF
jgi:hypothetical protein